MASHININEPQTEIYFTNGDGIHYENVTADDGIGDVYATPDDGVEDVHVSPVQSVDNRSKPEPAERLFKNPRRPRDVERTDPTIHNELKKKVNCCHFPK